MGIFDFNKKKKKNHQEGLFSLISDISADIMEDASKSIRRSAKKYGRTIDNLAREGGNKAKKVYKDVSDNIDAISFIAGDAIRTLYLKVKELITLPFLKFRTKIEVPEATKIQILEAKKNAVKVGIFDENNHKIAETRYESTAGVDPSIHAGYKKYEIFA